MKTTLLPHVQMAGGPMCATVAHKSLTRAGRSALGEVQKNHGSRKQAWWFGWPIFPASPGCHHCVSCKILHHLRWWCLRMLGRHTWSARDIPQHPLFISTAWLITLHNLTMALHCAREFTLATLIERTDSADCTLRLCKLVDKLGLHERPKKSCPSGKR